jgi:hypothetical protein
VNFGSAAISVIELLAANDSSGLEADFPAALKQI